MINSRGTLLLEVLIAAVILSVGILSCLNIFSASIHASSQTFEASIVQSYLDQALFPYFLDPTSVELSEGDQTLTHDGKSALRPHLRVEALSPVKEKSEEESRQEDARNKQNQKTGQPPLPKVVTTQTPSAEFFKTDFIADRKNGKVKYEFNEILYRYGQSKRNKNEAKKS